MFREYHYEFGESGVVYGLEGRDRQVRHGTAYVRAGHIERSLGMPIPDILRDLLDIARAAYVVERLTPRRRATSDGYHQPSMRRFRLTLPLREPARWTTPEIYDALLDVLKFLTEDLWEFKFIQRRPRLPSAGVQGRLLPRLQAQPRTVALFSGGLDSLAGICADREAHGAGGLLLCSGLPNPRIEPIQRRLIHMLRNDAYLDLLHIPVGFGLRQRHRRGGDESAVRSRGFIFASLGVVTALVAGIHAVTIYENGVGAMNLPYTRREYDIDHTRATDPRTLDRMKVLISSLTNSDFSFRVPFLFHTKAEMCREAASLGLADLLPESVSCDRFPQRVKGRPQSGWCTSCLFRRMSLCAAGIGDLDVGTYYRWDVRSRAHELSAAQMRPWKAMLYQVDTIRQGMKFADPWTALLMRFPDLAEVACSRTAVSHAHSAVEELLPDLLQRYCDEWLCFPAWPAAWPAPILA